MLHPRDAVQYGDTLNDVVNAFIKRMYYLRQCSPTGNLVTNMQNELYHFALEGICKTRCSISQLCCVCVLIRRLNISVF